MQNTPCNDKFSSWTITGGPLKGTKCSNSAVKIKLGNPTSEIYSAVDLYGTVHRRMDIDRSLTVRVYYSTVCQTMWAARTVDGTYRPFCTTHLHRTISPFWNSDSYGCPAPNSTGVTRMVDDHSPTHGIAANVILQEQVYRLACTNVTVPDGRICPAADIDNVLITFRYYFEY